MDTVSVGILSGLVSGFVVWAWMRLAKWWKDRWTTKEEKAIKAMRAALKEKQ